MRLIDANKLPRSHKVMLEGRLEAFENEWVSAYAIDNAPTVDAIPVKWIKNYASHKASKDLIDCYWHCWEDDALKMIEDWEKENDRD